ncbi:hypothetical protein WAK64_17695 [Bacillus spongiae]|uniref:Uncharacterized protein n=1 Tax=Bacillus spongiae TaxID=2683610 RepID=A0ABU8HHM9_9BACI
MQYLLEATPDLLLYSFYASIVLTTFLSITYGLLQVRPCHYDVPKLSDESKLDHSKILQATTNKNVANSPTSWIRRSIRLKAMSKDDGPLCFLI